MLFRDLPQLAELLAALRDDAALVDLRQALTEPDSPAAAPCWAELEDLAAQLTGLTGRLSAPFEALLRAEPDLRKDALAVGDALFLLQQAWPALVSASEDSELRGYQAAIEEFSASYRRSRETLTELRRRLDPPACPPLGARSRRSPLAARLIVAA